MSAKEYLRNIHKNLKIDFGSLEDEFPEQLMVAKYLSGHEKVLEIGGNIGRNSLVIAYILQQKNNNDFVSIETNPEDARKLKHNRDLNGFNFHVENTALSARKLIQKGWVTIPSDTIQDGYFFVDTITWEMLQDKYNIVFDTLVLDCEGAFYYILLDMPQILDNIQLIIVENDYCDENKKKYVDEQLKNSKFFIDYSAPHPWAKEDTNFYEVWKRKIELK